MECNFCGKTFKSISSLKNHKLTAKYCLKIQGKIDVTEISFECEYCNKILSTKQMLQLHLISCNAREIFIKKDEQLALLKEQKDKEIALLKEQKDKEMTLMKEELIKKTLHPSRIERYLEMGISIGDLENYI